MIIAKRIKELRLDKGMTQKELSELVGCNSSMVTRWEKEECEPTASAIANLAKALNCTADYLLGLSDI